MLTEQEIAEMRSDALEVMSETCDILRPTNARDAFGGISAGTSVVLADVPCRAQASGFHPDELQYQERTMTNQLMTFTLPWDAPLEPKDLLLYNGQRYEVIDAPTRTHMMLRLAWATLVR